MPERQPKSLLDYSRPKSRQSAQEQRRMNNKPMIGLVVVAIGMSFGGMHGYPINPARACQPSSRPSP
jgi:glycerol uptake facilitator-like aquaporin